MSIVVYQGYFLTALSDFRLVKQRILSSNLIVIYREDVESHGINTQNLSLLNFIFPFFFNLYSYYTSIPLREIFRVLYTNTK